jgi:Ser/Thr protein kinase RdoA (MazF antagonist)
VSVPLAPLPPDEPVGFWDSPACAPEWLATRGAVRWDDPALGPVTIRRARILYTRALPKRLTLLYAMDLAAGGRVWRERLVTGVVVAPERFDDERQARLGAARVEVEPGPAVVAVPEADLLLVSYPNDRRLRIPDVAALEAAVARHPKLRAALGSGGGPLEIEVLRYVPDKRWTARVRRAGDTKRSVVVKLAPDPAAAARAGASLAALDDAMRGAGLGLRVPGVLAVDAELGLVAVESLAGRDLERALPDLEDQGVLERAGALVARFHGLDVPTERTRSAGATTHEVREAAHETAWAAPELAHRVARLAVALGATTPSGSNDALLHGSLRMNHLFAQDDGLAMVDLDGVRRGPREYDLANFLASLYYLEAEGRIEPARRRRASRAFLRGYADGAPHAASALRTLWFLAALLIEKQAPKCATRPGPHRLRKTTRMVDLAERCLEARDAAAAAADPWSMLP